MEKKINWSLIASVLFGFVLAMLGYIVQQNDRRITKLELWREEHEKYSREQVVALTGDLREIKTKLDRLIQDGKE